MKFCPRAAGRDCLLRHTPGSHVFLSSHQSLSDCENDSAERAALNLVTQSISRLGQREGLSHDRFDRAGLKQRDGSERLAQDYITDPSFSKEVSMTSWNPSAFACSAFA
jgi:hypothetical protein